MSNENDERELVTFRMEGPMVRFDPQAKMWSLTEMHRAAGSDPAKTPARWLDNAQTADYLAALFAKCTGEVHLDTAKCTGEVHLTMPDRPDGGREGRAELAAWAQEVKDIATSAGLIETRRGNEGGTWAHWQIAAAYAHYLDPRFYLQWNEWAMAHYTRQIDAAHALEARVAALEEARRRPRPEGARVLLRRTVERMVEEVELRDIPVRPLTAAIRAVLAQAGRPLRPIEVTALLDAADVPVLVSSQVSGRLWHLAQRGDLTRNEDGCYRLADAA